ncbi:hypothetical protein ECEPECC34262_3348 [Escherichia coli EPEC C342-62]|nr:hypothetical protein ECEPECC34262_3348 [Escherichia coli EPEC C342-62]
MNAMLSSFTNIRPLCFRCGIAVLSVMPQIHQLAFHAAVAA